MSTYTPLLILAAAACLLLLVDRAADERGHDDIAATAGCINAVLFLVLGVTTIATMWQVLHP